MSLSGVVRVVAVVAAVTVAVVTGVASVQSSRFGDVNGGAYYGDAVAQLGRLGVFAGTECDEGFCPGGMMDRKTMAVWSRGSAMWIPMVSMRRSLRGWPISE